MVCTSMGAHGTMRIHTSPQAHNPRLTNVENQTNSQRIERWRGFARSVVIYLNPSIMRTWRRFYRPLLAAGDSVIDVGAHVGTRARVMRSLGAKVIALEPQQPFAGFLRATLPKDIVFIEAAAGSSEATGQLAVSSRHPTVSSLRTDFVSGAASVAGFEQVSWDDSQEVSVVTLDGVIAKHGMPRYIKIDVEGFEEEVLAGLSTAVELISVEFLPGFPQLSLVVVDRLMQLGDYRFNPVVGETGQFSWDEWQGATATKGWLRSLSPESDSGDLFARLQEV